ncbi:1-phosphofructokinase family hexose kinase [Streptomyces sp. NPDC059479]|uniref:1-phosphofructokinase family hexose kinase n=1 Tax=Streptomyces sp. NPDC059479 TaxID=3346848 RepID=UPI0036BDE4C8
MILTVTLNTALDITYRTSALVPHTTHRVSEVIERPGGKGLNVARVLAALGHETVVTGFAGGRTGDVLRELLANPALFTGLGAGMGPGGGPTHGAHGEHGGHGGPRSRPGRDAPRPRAAGHGVGPGTPSSRDGTSPAHRFGGSRSGHHRHGAGTGHRPGTGPAHRITRPVDALVPIAGSTRRTIAVVDGTSGDTTQLNEPGPTVSAAEWNAFLSAYERLLTGAEAVALCGSLPPGIHVGAYAELVRRARGAGVPVLLDTSGEPLRRGVAARPDLLKPNADELAGLTGSREPLRAAQDARRRGAHTVIASLGPDGILAATPDGVWQAVPPATAKGNPTGAGDSAVAGLLSGLVERLPWPARLSRAVALATATVLAPTAGEFDAEAYAELLPRVTVKEHPPA